MTWTAPGAFLVTTTSSLTMSNQAIGNLVLVEVINWTNKTVWASSISGGGCTWSAIGAHVSSSPNTYSAALFAGTVTATGAGTATIAWSGAAPANFFCFGREFHSSVGPWSTDKTGTIDVASGNNWASLTPAGNGELYFGVANCSTSSVSASTSGYVYGISLDSNGNSCAYNLNCAAGVATFPAFTDGNQQFGIMVLMQESIAILPQQAKKRMPAIFTRLTTPSRSGAYSR